GGDGVQGGAGGGPHLLPRAPPGARSALGAAPADPPPARARPAAAAPRRRARKRHGDRRGAAARGPGPGLEAGRAVAQRPARPRRGRALERRADAERGPPRMIVLKFGGSSVDGAAGIARVVGLVRERLDRRPAVVVSAMAKTTRRLLAAGEAAAWGDLEGARAIAAEIADF